MRIEWWYDDASFHLDKGKVYLACLTVRDDGTALLQTDGEEFRFPSDDEASSWLTSEEYSPLAILIEDLQEQGLPVDPRLRAYSDTDASSDGALLPLVVELVSLDGPMIPERQGPSPAKM